MDAVKEAIAMLSIPSSIAVGLILLYIFMQIIGEIIEFKGKAVPEFFKIRKFFKRKKQERNESKALIAEVKTLLSEVNKHYSADCIQKRNDWMAKVDDTMVWVNDRAIVYDNSIQEIKDTLTQAAKSFDNSVELTERMFIETSRDRIIDFAEKVSDPLRPVSREEFNRIFKVYDAYEAFLEERHKTNGEVEIAHTIIEKAYEEHMKNHTFIENIKNLD